jgi:membrane protein DedA with SNARE-associated domain
MSALDSLQIGSVLSYLIAFFIPALDAVFPVLPGESAIIALGVTTAGSVDPRIALLVGCAAAGAFIGDNVCYLLGRRFGPAVQRRFFATPKGAKARAWAERSLDRYGTQLIVVCRFIPGGRTAVTLTCGLTGYPRRRFVPATAVAAVIWALYAFFIGRLGGQAFENNPWAGLVIAFGASIAISAVIEVIRRLVARRRRRAPAGTAPADEAAQPDETARPGGPAQPGVEAQSDGFARSGGLTQPDGFAQPDGLARPDATPRPDGDARPDGTAPPDGEARPDATPRSDGEARPGGRARSEERSPVLD